MLRKEDVAEVLQRPEVLGRLVGFTDLTALHGQWIHEMVFGDEDYTLQAHRGAFKSSCLAVAIPLYMVLYPNRNVIFLRKTDHDVGEMMNMVAKVLQSDSFMIIKPIIIDLHLLHIIQVPELLHGGDLMI